MKTITRLFCFVVIIGISCFISSIVMEKAFGIHSVLSELLAESDALAIDPGSDDEMLCIQAMMKCNGKLTLVCKLDVEGDRCGHYDPECHLC